MCAVRGEDALAEKTMWKWFSRFKAGEFNLEDPVCLFRMKVRLKY